MNDMWVFLRRWLTIAGVVAFSALAGACADNRRPAVAAMVPQTNNGDFGYSDRMVAPDLYEITYVSPRLRADSDPAADHGLVGEKQRVYDLALWRAAQIAQENEFPAFRVQQESRDVDVTVRHDPVYPYPQPFLWGWGHRCWDCDWPFGYWPYYGYGYPVYRTSAAGRVVVNLTVEMLAQATADSLDTAATVERLSKAYGAASFSMTRAY